MNTAYPVQWTMGLISCGYPWRNSKDPATVVLTSFHSDGYRGNAPILFERLCSHPEFKPVWMSRNRKLVQELKDRFGGEKVCLTHSFEGIQTLSRSSAVFLTHGTSDYPFMRLPRQTFIIQTYHGLPTKRGEYMRPHSDRPPGFLHRKILEYRFRPITHFLSSSPLVTRLFSTRFGIPPDRFLETGYPAYDRLMSSHSGSLSRPSVRTTVSSKADRISRIWPDAPQSETLILYAPTFRRRRRTKWFPFNDLNPATLSRFLEENKALMVLRSHPNEKQDIRRFGKFSPRIVFGGQHIVEDVIDLLPLTDVIMTDYSSIYIEGLLLDIPALFLPYDLENYERGLPLPFEQISPGPKVFSQHKLLKHLKAALNRTDGYNDARRQIRDLYFATTDGDATGRIIRFLEDRLLSLPVSGK